MKPHTVATVETRLRAAIQAGDSVTIDALAVELDQLHQKPTPSILAAALWYAEQGLHVFPLTPREKKPLPGSRGCKDGTVDHDVIRAWWTATPDANLGVATGHLVDVIDVDGPEGVRTWARLAADETDPLPPLLGHVSTPRPGGNHLYVPASGRGNRAKIAPGVDYRGSGGYVVAPPSVLDEKRTPEGLVDTYPGTYVWVSPLNLDAVKESAA